MKMQSLLMTEVTNQVEELNKMELGTEQYKNTVDGITKLTDRAIEMERLALEKEKQFDEKTIEVQRLASEESDRKWRNGIAIGTSVLGGAITVWGVVKSFKFEETGTITTAVGRGFIQKLIPRK